MIYLLEDDKNIRGFVEYALNSVGISAKGFERPSEFYNAMKEELPALLLLDIMLPEEDGLSVLRRLRENPETERLPIIMLTAKSTEYDKVIGLDFGADDYLAKPFSTMELIARIKSLLRRCNSIAKPGNVYEFGSLCVDSTKRQVTYNGQNITLTYKEFELLLLLISEPGRVFTRSQILERIWGYEFDGENRTVDVHIRTLRAKLFAGGDLIETVRGVGYRMGGTAE